jgi:hypothetical protein
VLARYIEAHDNDRKSFDLDNSVFRGQVNDPDIVRKFRDKYVALRDERDPTAILLSIADTHGWNDAEIATLSNVTVDEYNTLFKQQKGIQLRKIIDACLRFRSIGNASEQMREISKRAIEALQCIGNESRVNALRVKKYGIETANNPGEQVP